MRRYMTYGFEGERWVSYFYFIGWDHWSLGLHVCPTAPNIEVHLPFGFIRMGRHTISNGSLSVRIAISECDEWQPINTAPQDGTEIDVWEFCHDPKWRPDGHGLQNGVRITDVSWSDGEWKKWDDRFADTIGLGSSDHYTVSHWMPKPSAPTSEEDAA